MLLLCSKQLLSIGKQRHIPYRPVHTGIHTGIIRRSKTVRAPAFQNVHDTISIIDMSYYIGKGIVLYTMFYCGLNYFMYKQMREESEKKDDVE